MTTKSVVETKDELIKSLSDEYGNLIISKNNGKRIIVKLKLSNEKTYRLLGVINKATKSIRMTRKRSMHLLIKAQTYGFNYDLLSSAKQFKTVRLEDEFEKWTVPVEYILKEGSFLFFKNQGFERQIFITLQQLKQFKKENLI